MDENLEALSDLFDKLDRLEQNKALVLKLIRAFGLRYSKSKGFLVPLRLESLRNLSIKEKDIAEVKKTEAMATLRALATKEKADA